MNFFLKNLIVRLLYNDVLKSFFKPIIDKFPTLKLKILYLRDSLYVKNISNDIVLIYEDGFLDSIKEEVEKRKKVFKKETT